MDSKLPRVGTTIFTVMSQMAARHGAINLSQGYPDFEPPEGLLERVRHHLSSGHNQYAPMPGIPELRAAVAAKIERIYRRGVDADAEITITSGATAALAGAIHAVVRPGDEAIVFDPAYDSYDPAVTLAGGRTLHLPLTIPDFRVDWDRVRDTIGDKTRLIILNSPHNPTGAILDRADLDALAELVRDKEIYVLSDEVYEHIIFDGAAHQSMLTHDVLYPRSFVVSSFGKTYHATGWKVGYCAAPPKLTAEFRKVHQFMQFCVVSPIQYALADFMVSDPQHYLELPAFYQAKRDLFCELLKPSRFELVPARSTYFQLADYGAISSNTDTEFANHLTREVGVAAIPVSVFYEDPPAQTLVRFCFAKDNATLERAVETLRRI